MYVRTGPSGPGPRSVTTKSSCPLDTGPAGLRTSRRRARRCRLDGPGRRGVQDIDEPVGAHRAHRQREGVLSGGTLSVDGRDGDDGRARPSGRRRDRDRPRRARTAEYDIGVGHERDVARRPGHRDAGRGLVDDGEDERARAGVLVDRLIGDVERRRDVVDRHDVDRDRGDVGRRRAIHGAVGERVGPEVVGDRRVAERPVRPEIQRSV